MRRTRIFFLCQIAVAGFLCGTLAVSGCSTDSGGPVPQQVEAGVPDPALPGPFPVGNLSLLMKDPSRHDRSTDSERQLMVEVWYPATHEADAAARACIVDFIHYGWAPLVEQVFGLLLPEEELAYLHLPTGSVPDAPLDRDHGPYPLVVFSHGNGGVRFQNHTLACHLASHGYIFVAPDHTENAAFAALPDHLVIYDPIGMPKSFIDRPLDLEFILDRLLEKNAAGSGDLLEGAIDEQRISAVGHSFGGLPVMLLAQFDPRIRAGVTLAGPWISLALFQLEIPMMYMVGREDRTVGVPYNDWIRDVYDHSPTPKLFIEFPEGGHYTFTDACGIAPTLFGTGDGCGGGTRFEDGSPFEYIDYRKAQEIQHAYILAFLEYTLKPDERFAPWLAANHYPDSILLSSEIP
jgi:predicted dienelactone hydrolase